MWRLQAVNWWACLVLETWNAFRNKSAVPDDATLACVIAPVQLLPYNKSPSGFHDVFSIWSPPSNSYKIPFALCFWPLPLDLFSGCTFSPPEPTILLACGRNREFWEQPFWNNKGNNRNLPIQFNAVCIYGACLKWLLHELSIPAAGQKDRRLWGRTGVCPGLRNSTEDLTVFIACKTIATDFASSWNSGRRQKISGGMFVTAAVNVRLAWNAAQDIQMFWIWSWPLLSSASFTCSNHLFSSDRSIFKRWKSSAFTVVLGKERSVFHSCTGGTSAYCLGVM